MRDVKAKARRETGFEAESKVVEQLASDGYKIFDRNYHSRYGELDIVAEKGGTIVFCEVKYRRNAGYGMPAEAVTASKQGKIIKTAEIYLIDKGLCEMPVRFDVAEVYGNGKINVIEDAFSLDGTYAGGLF